MFVEAYLKLLSRAALAVSAFVLAIAFAYFVDFGSVTRSALSHWFQNAANAYRNNKTEIDFIVAGLSVIAPLSWVIFKVVVYADRRLPHYIERYISRSNERLLARRQNLIHLFPDSSGAPLRTGLDVFSGPLHRTMKSYGQVSLETARIHLARSAAQTSEKIDTSVRYLTLLRRENATSLMLQAAIEISDATYSKKDPAKFQLHRERAEELLTKAIELAPDDADAYEMRARLAIERGNFQLAEKDLHRVTKLTVKTNEAQRCARAFRFLGELKAKSSTRKALEAARTHFEDGIEVFTERGRTLSPDDALEKALLHTRLVELFIRLRRPQLRSEQIKQAKETLKLATAGPKEALLSHLVALEDSASRTGDDDSMDESESATLERV